LAVCYGAQASVPSLSIADLRGNIYTPINTANNAVNSAVSWWYAKNIGGGAAGVASRVTLDSKRMKVCKICGQQAPDLTSAIKASCQAA
jgi:hypothetical protein